MRIFQKGQDGFPCTRRQRKRKRLRKRGTATLAVVLAAATAMTCTAMIPSSVAGEQTKTLSGISGPYEATVSYSEDAGLPEDVALQVAEIGEDSEDYQAARDAVVNEKKTADEDFDEDSLGMTALDISILDKDGKEIEPENGSKVSVKIALSELPEGMDAADLDGIEVQHIKDGTAETVDARVELPDADNGNDSADEDSSGQEPAAAAETPSEGSDGEQTSEAGTASDDSAGITEEESAEANSTAGTEAATLEFETDSFSTFAITYQLAAKAPKTYNITCNVTNGTIKFNGEEVNSGSSQSVSKNAKPVVSYLPDDGYELVSVKVDDEDVTSGNEKQYTFGKVQKNHTITVTYKKSETIKDDGEDISHDAESVTAGLTLELSPTTKITGGTWSSSDTDAATVDQSGTVTGVAEGETMITYTYESSNGTTHVETWNVTVTESADSDKTEISSDSTSNDLPTVKVRGNKKALGDMTLNIAENDFSEGGSASDYESEFESDTSISDFGFLHKYRIWLTDSDGDVTEPSGKYNLNVTLTYSSEPAGWDAVAKNGVYVAHYGYANGKVTTKELGDGTGDITDSVKQIKVKSNKYEITFHLQSFSQIVVGAKVLSTSSEETPAETVDNGETYGSQLAKYSDSTQKANQWQMVSGQYNGNSSSNKTTSSDGNIRIQKNVVPTDVENEFLVYLSVDKKYTETVTKENINAYLATEPYAAYTANGFPDGVSKGDLCNTGKGDSTTLSSGKGNKDKKTFTVTIKYNGTTIGSGTFNTPMSNGNIYIKLAEPVDGNSLIALGNMKDSDREMELDLGSHQAAYNALIESVKKTLGSASVTSSATLNGVSDSLNDGFSYIRTNYADGSAAPSGGAVNWSAITEKTNPEKVTLGSETLPSDSTTTVERTTTWYNNVAELVYKVKYNPTVGSLNSSGQLDTVNDPTSFENTATGQVSLGTATLTYNTNSEVTTSTPEIRGMLYDIAFDKVDSEDSSTKLDGAVFTLTKSGDSSFSQTAKSSNEDGSKGRVLFSGLSYGTYTLTETTAPSGYQTSTSSWTFDIPENAPNDNTITFVADTENGQSTHALWQKSTTENITEIQNTKEDTPLTSVLGSHTGAAAGAAGVIAVIATAAYLARRRKRYPF